MKVTFQDKTQIEIVLNNSIVRPVLIQMFKHLQHVPLNFYDWDCPYYYKDNLTWDQLVAQLKLYGQRVNIVVDHTKLTTLNQLYLNQLHMLYEQNYNGSPEWLQFHEHIHICENYHSHSDTTAVLDYREQGGIIEKKFNFEWIKESSTKVCAGDVFWTWSELGKSPYDYWRTNEPDELTRMCELAKPWLLVRPKIRIALEDNDRLANIHIDEFNNWWKNYHDDWCNHWSIPNWPIEYQFAQIVVGKITPIDAVKNLFKNGIYPNKISLT